MTKYLDPIERLGRLTLPEGVLSMVLDTDTCNEVDDQFALMYALASPERLRVEAVYAAPISTAVPRDPRTGWRKVTGRSSVCWMWCETTPETTRV
jgi:hypothetical protein